MNLDGMRLSVRSMARDEGGQFIRTEDIDFWLNEAQRDLAARLRHLMKVVADVVGAASSIDLPADLLAIHSITVDGYRDQAQFVNDDTYASWAASALGNTLLYRVFGGTVMLNPDVTGAAYSLEYAYAPANLEEPGDVSLLPLALHPKMVDYGRYMMYLKEGDTGNADRCFAMYEQGLPQKTIGNPARVPTPLTLKFQPGPFDTSDATHW